MIMKLIFFGTPDYVLPILDTLHKEFKSKNSESPIAAVVTQPPKPVGRLKQVEYSPVDHWAHKKNIPVYYDAGNLLNDSIKADIGIVAAYGSIISQEVLNYFPHGLLNLHFSTLPEFRGASPVHAALITGQKEMGITIFKLDKGLDHGPIVSQFKVDIEEEDTVESLRNKGFAKCAEVLQTLLPAYIGGKINVKQQDHSKATYSSVITKEDAFIPQEIIQKAMNGNSFEFQVQFIYKKTKDNIKVPYQLTTSYQLLAFIRAMQPWPEAWTFVTVNGTQKRLKIKKAHLKSEPAANNKLQTTYLLLDDVQLEGKNPVSWKQFKEAYKDFSF